MIDFHMVVGEGPIVAVACLSFIYVMFIGVNKR